MAKSPVLPIVGVSTPTGSVPKPPIGALSDRFGRRTWFFTARVLFTVFPFLYRFVDTPDQLFWLRIAAGRLRDGARQRRWARRRSSSRPSAS